jgi:hypothetical protein
VSRSELDRPTFPAERFQERGISSLYGFDPAANLWRRITVNPGGSISVAAVVGTVITTVSDTNIPPFGTVSLPTAPPGTLRMTVQNTGAAGSLIRVRAVGDPAGSGFILPRFASKEYGGFGGSIDSLEVQEIAGMPASVMVQFEVV